MEIFIFNKIRTKGTNIRKTKFQRVMWLSYMIYILVIIWPEFIELKIGQKQKDML